MEGQPSFLLFPPGFNGIFVLLTSRGKDILTVYLLA